MNPPLSRSTHVEQIERLEQERDWLIARIAALMAALQSIAARTGGDGCQTAARIARQALDAAAGGA